MKITTKSNNEWTTVSIVHNAIIMFSHFTCAAFFAELDEKYASASDDKPPVSFLDKGMNGGMNRNLRNWNWKLLESK